MAGKSEKHRAYRQSLLLVNNGENTPGNISGHVPILWEVVGAQPPSQGSLWRVQPRSI
jgi:hypothetical protein